MSGIAVNRERSINLQQTRNTNTIEQLKHANSISAPFALESILMEQSSHHGLKGIAIYGPSPLSRVQPQLPRNPQCLHTELMRLLPIAIPPSQHGKNHPLMYAGSGIGQVIPTQAKKQRQRRAIQKILQSEHKRPACGRSCGNVCFELAVGVAVAEKGITTWLQCGEARARSQVEKRERSGS
jgi:hypothetical protein